MLLRCTEVEVLLLASVGTDFSRGTAVFGLLATPASSASHDNASESSRQMNCMVNIVLIAVDQFENFKRHREDV
jgi:hypothetical protein